nr:MAG TPA: hypothetical protein [Microviridae sp.]
MHAYIILTCCRRSSRVRGKVKKYKFIKIIR